MPHGSRCAEADGIRFPDTLSAAGKALQLNGLGLRTYSWLGIHVYVAALYLEQASSNAAAIMQSQQTKLLTVRFEHDVNSEQARAAWREGFANNCIHPCRLNLQEEEQFLTKVPAMRTGDTFSLLFTESGVKISAGSQPIGQISDAAFAEAMLSVFLGPRPASESLKENLLRGQR